MSDPTYTYLIVDYGYVARYSGHGRYECLTYKGVWETDRDLSTIANTGRVATADEAEAFAKTYVRGPDAAAAKV
jgi:hypothetical protein